MKEDFEIILDNSATKPQSETAVEARPLVFEEVVTPEHLEMISRASGGFRFREDPSLPPGSTGYTRLDTREICFNPLLLRGSPELGIKPWKKVDIEGFCYHESGHHAPEVTVLQERLLAGLKKVEIPEDYKGSPTAEQRFLQALHSHLDNALADIWLESFMGRRPFFPVQEAISKFQKGKGDIEDFKGMSLPDQFLQALLRSRYFEQKNIKDGVSPEVFEALQKAKDSGAMRAMMEKGAFENYFASPADKDRAIEKKMIAYNQVFLPEYLKLMQAELEKRKKQKQGDKGQGQGQGGGGSGPSNAVPLTKEEEQELVEQIIGELEQAGKEFQSLAPSEEEKQQNQQMINELKKILEKRAEEKGKEEPEQPEEVKGEEAIKNLAREFERKERERQRKGLAEAMQVRQESIRHWEMVKTKYRIEIESLSGLLADVFLDDRRKRLDYLRREGEIVPGLEYETISALLSGELDPETMMSTVRNPEFLETELEFIVDTSGSMSGQKIEKSIDLMVIVAESLKKVKESLSDENLLAESEDPFRVGVTKFSDTPERVTKLNEPVSDKKEVKIIDQVSKLGGGTEESAAISEVYEELKLGKKNVIKIICVLTDGQGNQAGVRPIIQQIENDKEVIFLAVGLGDSAESAKAIVDTYVAPLNNKEGNIHGFATEDPDKALPAVIEFLKREINKRKQ